MSLKTHLDSCERRLSAPTASNMAECAGNKFLMSHLERLKAPLMLSTPSDTWSAER